MDVTLTGNGEAERVAAARVTHVFFKVLGLTPIIGRVFGPGEDGVVLSHSLWERKFASSTSVLGTVIRLDGFSGTVVGVLPQKPIRSVHAALRYGLPLRTCAPRSFAVSTAQA